MHIRTVFLLSLSLVSAVELICFGLASAQTISSSTSNTTPLVITRPLYYGMSGSDVSALQQFLKNLGYFTYPTTTGYYGTFTWKAVAEFQWDNGLGSVGIVGPKTRALIVKQTNTSVFSTVTPTSPTTLAPVNTVPAPKFSFPPGIQPGFGGGGSPSVSSSVASTPVTEAPTVTTQSASSVTATSATLNGNITATGGANPTVRGFAWGTNSSLSDGDTATTTDTAGQPFSAGSFTGSLSSLSGSTAYYFRPYATNSAGTSFGTIQTFTTLSTITVGDQTLSFGALTLAGAGGIAPTTTVGTISTTTIIGGNTANHWQIAANGTLTPTATGDTADLNQGPYSITILFGDGTNTDQATITITIESNVYAVTSGELSAVINLGSVTIDGKTIKGRPGADIGGANIGDTVDFATTLNFSTGLIITSDSTSNPAYIRRLSVRHIGTVELRDLIVRDYFKSGDTNDVSRIINFANNSSGRSSLILRRIEVYANDDISTQDFLGGNVAVLKIIANDGGITFNPDLTIIDSNFHDFGRAITGTFRNLTITGNSFSDAAADFISLAPVDSIVTWLIENNTVKTAWGMGTDPQNPHVDAFQFNMAGVTSSNPIITVRGNRVMSKGGREPGIQGIFIENQTTGDASFAIENNIIETRSAHGITVERPSASTTIRYNTIISNTSTTTYGYVPAINIFDEQGVADVAHNAVPSIALTNSPTTRVHNNYEFGSGASSNEDADYAAIFNGTNFGTDSIVDFNELVTALTPKSGGALDLDLGTDRGARYYNWNTLAYTPPPNIKNVTDIANGTTALTGSVITDVATGTLYWFISTNSLPPSTTVIFKNGTGAEAYGSQAVSASGTQNISASSLTTDMIYYLHVLHEDASSQQSEVISGDGFTLGTPPFIAVAVDNQGTVYGATSAYSGGSASQAGTYSFWFYVDAESWPSTSQTLFDLRDSGGSPRVTVTTSTSGRLSITGKNSSGTIIFARVTNTSTFSTNTWYHVMSSHDLSIPTGSFYKNNTEITSFSSSVTTNDTIPALGRVGVFANTTGSSALDGFLSDVWFDHDTALDLSNSAVRANFIDQSTLKPVDISAYGSPHLRLNNPVASWFTNTGSGGNPTATGGSLIAASSSPSD